MFKGCLAALLCLLPAVVVSEQEALTDANIKAAVNEWIANSTTATEKYGSIDVWNTSQVTNMLGLFKDKTLFDDDISGWDVSSVTNMNRMFEKAQRFNGVISGWNVSKVTGMTSMFNGAWAFDQDISGWNVFKVTAMNAIFYDAIAFNQDLSKWDVASVEHMSSAFSLATIFNQDLSNWNVSNVKGMFCMFCLTDEFDQNLSEWDVSKVTNMQSMFSYTKKFDQNLSEWNVSKVTNMYGMFESAQVFDQDLLKWDVSKATNMQRMFRNAFVFNQDLSKWDVSRVTNMKRMFASAKVFNQDLSKWDVSKVTNMHSMFQSAMLFNQVISGWNLSEVTIIDSVFLNAQSFNQNLCPWGDSLRSVADASGMFVLSSCPTTADPDLDISLAGPFCHGCGILADFPAWQITNATFVDGVGVSSISFHHGVGDSTTPTRVKIYGLPSGKNETSTDITDACYSNGGDLLGNLDDGVILGLDITEYQHNVADEKTSFDFTFNTEIKSNFGLYYQTELVDDNSKLATIRFCAMLELLGPKDSGSIDELEVYTYVEYAFGYNATLNGTIVLANAFQVEPVDPDKGEIEDDTFAVEATVCGPDGFVAGNTLSQGDSVHICINSTSYPEASISGIDSLTYAAPFGYLEAIKNGVSDDLLTLFDAAVDCDGSQCIVKTQLKARFFPADGFAKVTISGKAAMELGGRRVLAEIVPGDRSLQEGESQSGFSIDVETSAFDTSSAGTTKKGVAASIVLATLAAVSLRFF